MAEIEIEIDGKKLIAQSDAMVIQVADAAGIYIPRFCYHKHLSVAANCRMCLVEVEKSPKALPACATPVMPGMRVFTRSAKAIAAQKAVMEFLLINHPLDCPICDQGGECELQDLSMGYGGAKSFYSEGKRSIKDKDIGPLISTEMTRCIQCTRCVRFGSEVAGFRELGVLGRGEKSEISTYIQHALHSEVSGNIIDLCPVGALTSKPYRFTARPWELKQYPSIAAHDCLGSHINVHTREGRVMRVVPREQADINQTWLADRDRYSYEGLYHRDRLAKPMIRVEDEWQETDWQTALEFATEGLQKVLNTHGAEQFAALTSPSATLEEMYLLQKLMRGVGSPHIDYRLRQTDFSDQAELPIFLGLNMSLTDLEKCDVILLVGSNIQQEQPLAALRVRKAALKGAKVMALNMLDYAFRFPLAQKNVIAPQHFVQTLANLVEGIESTKEQEMASLLKSGKKIAILLGAPALNHPEAAAIRYLSHQLAQKTQGVLGYLTEGANASGAALVGALPHRGVGGSATALGMSVEAMWKNPRKAYLLLNVEPDLDCANSAAAARALEESEFTVALSLFKNPLLEHVARVILPIAAFTETAGTFVNVMGEWQNFKGVATAYGEARPAWKVLRVLAHFLKCADCDYESTDDIRAVIQAATANLPSFTFTSKTVVAQKVEHVLYRIGDIPIYAGDSIVRRAPALQATQDILLGHLSVARIHPLTAKRLQLEEAAAVIVQQETHRVRLPLMLDERVPESAVYIPGGLEASSKLSQLFGALEIHKA